jgi:superfamily I DNA and/or RNA helicase
MKLRRSRLHGFQNGLATAQRDRKELADFGVNNRLNVATSRAKCLCILVASPRVFEAECRTPSQMQLANAFCRYLELVSPL